MGSTRGKSQLWDWGGLNSNSLLDIKCFFFVFFFVGNFVFSEALVPPQASVLLQFRAAVKDPRAALKNWTVGALCDSCHCRWYGIKCQNGRVTEMRLGSAGLGGSLPPIFSNLTSLQILNLSSNSFSGGLPKSLGDLKNLQTLDLSFNKLKGSVPLELGNIYTLKEMDLSSNSFSGGLPDSLENLINLETLILHGNKLSGSISTSFSPLKNLTKLDLHNNLLSGKLPGSLTTMRLLNYLLFIKGFEGFTRDIRAIFKAFSGI